MIRIVCLGATLAALGVAEAQYPFTHPAEAVELRFARSQPVVSYMLRVDSADLSGWDVEMRIRNVPDTFHLAMAAHPEYDDRFWRFVENLRVAGHDGAGVVTRVDSALWRVIAPGGEAIASYRITLPPQEGPLRAAWRPFLSPTGALTGGPHAFMYILGAELAPAHVVLDLPRGWLVATGLAPTADPRTYFASSVDVLVDSPILMGRLRSWRFAIDGVPHEVAYWPLPDARAFDTLAFVGNVERLARATVALFGRAPYREYAFLFQDGAFSGGLEHINSVTLGAESVELAADPAAGLGETAHEFIHTWNLMRIRPAERGGVDYRPPAQSAGLWWSEGLTMYYADALLRRASLPTADSTRVAHLQRLIASYLSNPSNYRISPERASMAEYGAPVGSLGDYDASPHLQGELIGTILDLIIRGATNDRRSVDDLMRVMLERFSGERGFTGRDIEQATEELCGCDVTPLFDTYIRAAAPLEFDRYLQTIGLHTRVTWTPALDREGRPATDLRVRAWQPGDGTLRVLLYNPESAWGRAGLHTGDRVVSMNGAPVSTWPEFRTALTRASIGDTIHVGVMRGDRVEQVAVPVIGYNRPVVSMEQVRAGTERQRALRARWLMAAP